MKRTAGILLLAVYLFSFAEFHNLLKLPVLFEHYKEHKREDPSISFWAFLKIHYFDKVVVDDDYDRDQQLPFRDVDCCVATASLICECLPVSVEIKAPEETRGEFYLFNDQYPPQFRTFDIFQPPRRA